MKKDRYPRPLKAHITGLETEGELAGEVVCPFVYVWKINSEGRRYKIKGKIAHDAEIVVYAKAQTDVDGTLYLVRQPGGASGWTTGRFVDFGQKTS